MSKADFFLQLQERLRGLPPEERQNIIRVYEDLFAQAEASGKNELDIIRSLGFTPLAEIPSVPPAFPGHRPPQRESGVRKIAAAIALGLFNLIFVLAPFIAAAGLLFSLALIAIVFSSSTLWILLGSGIPTSTDMLLLELFTAMTLTGLGVLIGMGVIKLNRKFTALTKRYVAHNLRLIRGE